MSTGATHRRPFGCSTAFLYKGVTSVTSSTLPEGDRNCTICYETYEDTTASNVQHVLDIQAAAAGQPCPDRPVRILACRHTFGLRCLTMHVRGDGDNNRRCPMCRAQLIERLEEYTNIIQLVQHFDVLSKEIQAFLSNLHYARLQYDNALTRVQDDPSCILTIAETRDYIDQLVAAIRVRRPFLHEAQAELRHWVQSRELQRQFRCVLESAHHGHKEFESFWELYMPEDGDQDEDEGVPA